MVVSSHVIEELDGALVDSGLNSSLNLVPAEDPNDVGNASPGLKILVVLAIIGPFAANGDAVLDTDGEALNSGSEYFILPVNGGGLRLQMRNNTCPMYVNYEKDNDGLPVVFTPYLSGTVIEENADLTVVTSAFTICIQSTRWVIATDSDLNKRFIATGGDSSSSSIDLNYFKIVKSDNYYQLVFCPTVCDTCRPACGSLATYSDEDGNEWLVVDQDDSLPFQVQFKKA
ncbi:hypothetical protein KI387_033805 [Taxus chinensis]|uniref:Uncharacterized protein n=1 Tax=Taxus chinensis TaxID=29808 RepID=A0AA38F4S6_TAXCH|nr:hypothetical protein KI387_033805 [Taxus chinensis]